MPVSTVARCWSGNSSWSAASISASSLIVSTAGPLKRKGSERCPVSPVAAWICSERDKVSGLYCSEMIRSTRADTGSISTSPPFSTRGELGKVVITLRRKRDHQGDHLVLPSGMAERALHPTLGHSSLFQQIACLAADDRSFIGGK